MFFDKIQTLTPKQYHVLINKGTERPYSGAYQDAIALGSYLCRRCGLALFRADNKFSSACGWPSFDDEIANTILQTPDPDGARTEILCKRCAGHLGHIFHGEGFTAKNQRYCVNATSLDFVASQTVLDTQEAIIAGGCFWGVEHLLQELPGVLLTEVGYCGGETPEPTYERVCRGDTNHVEACRVVFDTAITTYSAVIKYFFEIHNPSQRGGQGPDRGSQYLSRIFTHNDEQRRTALQLIAELVHMGLPITTEVLPAVVFWPAEEYHQAYYKKHNTTPYCHVYTKRFT